MDELKIAAGIICAAIASKSAVGMADFNADTKATTDGYWKIYNALKTSKDNPDNEP